MSDIFDHSLDAMESLYGGQDNGPSGYSRRSKTYCSIDFISIEHETEKAILYKFETGLYWIPKSQINDSKIETKLRIPRWLAKETNMLKEE